MPLSSSSTSSLRLARARNRASKKVVMMMKCDNATFMAREPTKSLMTKPVAMMNMSKMAMCLSLSE